MERKTFSKFDNTVYILGSLSFFGEVLKVRCVKPHFHSRVTEINTDFYFVNVRITMCILYIEALKRGRRLFQSVKSLHKISKLFH